MPDYPKVHLLYKVMFFTYGPVNPERLGTAERQVGSVKVWAHDADRAQEEARRIVAKMGHEWLATLEVTAPYEGLYVEQIMNDPLNPQAILADTTAQEPVKEITLVKA